MAKSAKQQEEGEVAPLEVGTAFSDVLTELDAEQSRITVRLELRRFRKKTTVIEGLTGTRETLANVAHELKKKLATGGSAKDGIIILQGDQRDRAKDVLSGMGYPVERIEVQ